MKASVLVALAANGCMASGRFSALATVDSLGHPGAMLAVGGSLGLAPGNGGGVLFTPALEGGIVRPHPITGDLRGTVSVEYYDRWKRLAFRVGPRAGFSWVDGSRSNVDGEIGGTVGVLPTLFARPADRVKQPTCTETDFTSYHLGLAGQADYEWADHRGHFGLGPSFEILSNAACD